MCPGGFAPGHTVNILHPLGCGFMEDLLLGFSLSFPVGSGLHTFSLSHQDWLSLKPHSHSFSD